MKLILCEYLRSLRERDELDAILPDLLSESGFNVLSRPGRGTAQSGVDVAAIGEEDGERKMFLLAIKRGNLTRQEWDGSPQALRATLNEIRDVYLPTKVPSRYRDLKVVICICLGGDVQEQVRGQLIGYMNENATPRVSYQEWNGDKIAEMLLSGPLREEILPRNTRASFRKSVAMVDEPDVSYRHFRALISELSSRAESTPKARVRVARQVYICLWVLFVWAREADNVEAPYRAGELALLAVWDIRRPLLEKSSKSAVALRAVSERVLLLHLAIAEEFLDRKVMPHVATPFAISLAVQSREAADINLKLFDLLGRLAMTGLWYSWFATQGGASSELKVAPERFFEAGRKLIVNNPCLRLPLCDHQAIQIALFLLLAIPAGADRQFLADWLSGMAKALSLTVATHGRYPTAYHAYRELVAHPREQTTEYRREATAGSILVPLLACWLAVLGREEEFKTLVKLKQEELSHCTLQLWLPEDTSEDFIYTDRSPHGISVEVELTPDPDRLFDTIKNACNKEDGFLNLSAYKSGWWPVILVACRHYRLPVPPQFWLRIL